jgi:hypothetical protein
VTAAPPKTAPHERVDRVRALGNPLYSVCSAILTSFVPALVLNVCAPADLQVYP